MKKMTIEAWKKCPVCGKTENQVRAGYNRSECPNERYSDKIEL